MALAFQQVLGKFKKESSSEEKSSEKADTKEDSKDAGKGDEKKGGGGEFHKCQGSHRGYHDNHYY